MLTVVGACASSTGGGIKVSRLLVGIKCIKREIVQLAHPKSVGIIRIGGKKSVPIFCVRFTFIL